MCQEDGCHQDHQVFNTLVRLTMLIGRAKIEVGINLIVVAIFIGSLEGL